MDITNMSEQELKAMAYDEMQRRDIATQNLDIINKELVRRIEETQRANKEISKPKKTKA
jgi:hypothetical protein